MPGSAIARDRFARPYRLRLSHPCSWLETDAARPAYRAFVMFAVQPAVVQDERVRQELEQRVGDVLAELRAEPVTPFSPEQAYHALRAIAINAGVEVERTFDPGPA